MGTMKRKRCKKGSVKVYDIDDFGRERFLGFGL